jgi:hypothetical protein
MDHQLIVHLTDNEYAALLSEAQEMGEPIEALSHELLVGLLLEAKRVGKPAYQLLSPHLRSRSARQPKRLSTKREIDEYLYSKGLLQSLPTGEFSEEREKERKRLADLLGQGEGKPASEMVIEDRGPY